MSRNLYYVLPLPLSAPSLKARLAGISILRIPDGLGLECATVKKLLLSKIPPHGIVSPIYLFKQHIDPFNLKHGLNSLEFLSECSEQLKPINEHDMLISFALRHLSVFNSMAIQNFYAPDVFQRFKYVIDLKVALSTCAYFGNTRLKQITNLNQVAKDLGFTGDLTNQITKTEAMYFIYNYLQKNDPKIMAFLSQDINKRLTLEKQAYYVYLEDLKLYIIKVINISLDGRIIKAIKSNGNELVTCIINNDYASLIAPLSILTKERQQEHKFDLQAALKRIENTDLSELLIKDNLKIVHKINHNNHNNGNQISDLAALSTIVDDDLPFYDKFFKRLDEQERNIFLRLMNHDLRQEPSLSSIANASSKFSALIMCYVNENFPSACFESERQLYIKYCNEQLKRRAGTVVQECQMLLDNIKENNTEDLTFLKRVSSYF